MSDMKLTDKSVQLALASLAEKQTSVSVQPTVPAQPVFVASSTAIALPRDNAFGYALPQDIGLTPSIEASPDLVHWSPATNVVFYFKDLESSNFNERFYRFPEK